MLITRFFAEDGVGEIQDFMPVGGDGARRERHRLIRRVLCVRGSHAVPGAGRAAVRLRHGPAHRSPRLEAGVVFTAPGLTLA